jgi:hypothetical protein
MKRMIAGPLLAALVAAAWPGAAQSLPPSTVGGNAPFEVEAAAGGAWFLDESAIGHGLAGVGGRVWLTPRVAVGPEYTYWVGPGNDRDQTLTGNLTYAFRDSGLTPFVVAGAGLFRHSDRFGSQTFSSSEGSFTMGGGMRIPFRAGWYIAPEARIGWEPHIRLHVAVGRRFSSR